jgi:hypothetical protein
MEDRTLSMMEIEDWRPKLTPNQLGYLAGLRNSQLPIAGLQGGSYCIPPFDDLIRGIFGGAPFAG